MSAPLAWALFCGTALGVGLWSLASLVPRLSRPRLVQRLAPYILDVSAEARAFVGRTTVHPIPVLGTLFAPTFGGLKRGFAAVLGGTDTIERRLRQSGSSRTADAFRSEQVVWSLIALAAGAAAVTTVPTLRTLPVLMQVGLPAIAGVCGALARDWALKRAATARLARMQSEFPTVLEFMTLSLSAGEGILDALGRVSRTSTGELSRELAGVVADVRTGVPLSAALQNLARRIALPSVTRLVDQVVGALERGTPLADVLRAQAQDARDEARRGLIEVAGKKEVAMLVPLVFLILPMTILFAIFPGLFILQSGF
ncbi:type II secretion system F family protein [Cryobacterium sp. TMT1-21]|uniref:Type II secretion system F family protein n=1 Tax=Cryobacterium shii TaxID=1259235 RepID=A0AAQ2HHF4_9MICO|nr:MULTISPECIES: type II secretion system F family protein [Cryobacterium]TFC53238.1 type II secretion system F family protein [Cryobacterium shii]TFC83196.1 type II secretion system F family protein [Cryobacterium sp. TmT2-59]TFD17955.1 type II secretion system F family protein [Cryobacterium sp. TMT4-10]TFD18158.1 type II secretion system F family protein [Cryobacterium sp. TMT1-21]TFD24974.1 type II secretion system F family protein [Cryobacterium sp. TMT2-23]